MTATAALTTDLQRQVLALETDLRGRLAADAEREGEWKREHHRAVEKERTAASWTQWRDDRVTQAAVAWILTTVFIRFCEDNALLKPVWITGPGSRRQEALDAQKEFFRRQPEDTGREWLLDAIDYLAKLPATRGLVESHSALYLIAPSGQAADELLTFWRRRDEDGYLIHDLADPELSTRFLGDLYQDLSQHAKDTYALLQTPVFVEEFILDRTMEPALKERPLEGFLMIDPACGSGHFLLGAFTRLLDRWHKQAPGLDTQARVQKALDSINGVDLNPFAIAIARFRLLLAALQAAGLRSLEDAPAFTVNLAAGDSLIHGPDPGVLPGMSDRSAYMPFTYRTEDADLLLTLLEEGRYDVVVGNPPYITVKDKALNKIYRVKYADVCKGTYALTVPFMKLMFSLAKLGDTAGWVGQITSNSFMKREFGTKLIEDYLAKIDLQLVVDSSGAYIPGHGTPTVIIVGRNRAPEASTVRAVLGVRGEPGRPDNPAEGLVWTAITEHVDQPGWSDGWITVADLDRQRLATHPWSLAGGGALELIKRVEDKVTRRMQSVIVPPIGRSIRAGADEVFLRPASWRPSDPTLAEQLRPIAIGENVRDWNIDYSERIFYPYIYGTSERLKGRLDHELWPWRQMLAARGTFSGDMAAAGLEWWEYMQHTSSAYRAPLSIAFAFVATHNHFVLDRGGNVFKQSAPVIKLPDAGTIDEHLALLGLLNSSTACFWLKQVSHDKGSQGVNEGFKSQEWERFYEFTGTKLMNFPMPAKLPLEFGRHLDRLALRLASTEPSAVCEGAPSSERLEESRVEYGRILAQMIALQEELDWEVYRIYGFLDEVAGPLTEVDSVPGLALGERAFEIALARRMAAGEESTEWFARHGSTPITEIPEHWPSGYRELVRRRLELIESHPFIRLLERPEYKRRWAQEPWEKRQERALREWLLDRLEDRRFWVDSQGRPGRAVLGSLPMRSRGIPI